jgi:chemotaxis protein methyltransferase CheR
VKNLLDRSDLERLAQIVRDETGNQVQEKNFSMLSSRLQGRLIKLGLSTMEEYWKHFSSQEAEEREVLQGLMTTHYTFFFREYAHFEALAKWIDQESARLKERYQADRQPVHVWSAACSRGHEVYSLAAFLSAQLTKKYGVPFEVLGTDICNESISYAQNGVYPIKEVNTIPQTYLNGFWKRGTGKIKDFAAAHPNIRAAVKFEPLNLLEIANWTNTANFDVVFCRNVFIYFSDANVRQIATNLVRRMQPRGLFVSGISEPIRFEGWNYPIIGPSSYQLVSPDALIAPNTTAPSSRVAPREKYRVLCVDDSPTIQTLMKAIFKTDPNCAGVDTALNGNEARKKLDAEKYQLITLDIHMPECNGIEFLERHYVRASDPPVLMVSSVNRSDVDLATKALSLGAFDYVEKPAMNKIKESTQEILT